MPRFHAATPAAPLIALCLLPALLVVTGCGDRTLGERLGMGKSAPDEFAIVRRAPLIMPPDYNLRPPRPGESGPQETTAPALARADLTGQPAAAAAGAAQSAGQRALLDEAGAAAADPQIRQRIAAEAGAPAAADDRTLFGRLFDFGGPAPAPGDVVDAAAEAERLRTARDEGLPPTAGETPMVVRRSSQPTTFETLGGQTSLGTAGEQVF